MTGQFEGRTVLISGAARGQGRTHAVRFAREGADVIAFDIARTFDDVDYPMGNEEDLAETVRLVEAEGRRIHAQVADVRDEEAVRRVTSSGSAALGTPSVIVANAAIVPPHGPAWEMSDSMFRQVIDVNLIGVWHTLKIGVQTMLDAGITGSCIAIGSGASIKGIPNISPYVASKHALVGLVRSFARELGPHGIRVNLVLPGNVNTPMFDNMPMRKLFVPEQESPDQETFRERASANIPMGQFAVEPDDITDAVVFLASEQARFVTGALLPVDGGSGIP